ncbi:DoxX family protein OS=Tsukamurella paurometabola (strain ATCC 8368 / DSM / CCUG 35730 / CIP 100753 / JCM 10117 / KCTC 9821 / NBRC 16120 / NCIMB 702349/ NCTC 13040) OX=521096 GN=Tpau_3404 PE=4 SV=1 [Tsukamurella paurometabola]|uniref:DoxX family protein n=1 Tax=Tsukamurella paurometabola (strain ATCC 8368 / DSM 20162 / CCUG 35730 / CIP 100753 / JCM 10117 / KCTC 9821 / NBRC 16120 / NCIMB 702349 / NCTC 13040) TaxID=521096 RepID=D5UWI9_TSUPD|nr:DoxX family protein [Tsukamurella paurometabola]ADG79988.1 conserved hypothetical protein [Tsukamurella paurometabola DSM 20162]SUP37944.1 Uncharacterised protein [Tsukamurella paurometabola]
MRTGTDVLRDPRLYRLAAALQATDAAICVPPIPYVRRCLDDVHWPQEHRWFFPLVKAASAVGLAAAPRFPRLGRVTTTMLTLYFSVAVGAHLRARDLRFNFVGASSLLTFYAALAASGPPRAPSNP